MIQNKYLFRALSDEDLKEYNSSDSSIHCTFYRLDKNAYYKLYKTGNKFSQLKKSLDTVIGHVNGQTLKVKKSPWISASKNIRFIMTEYAVPQNGKYNISRKRKPIAVIKPKNIYSGCTELKNLLLALYQEKQSSFTSTFMLDISEGNLSRYFYTEWIARNTYQNDNNHIIDRRCDNPELTSVQIIKQAANTFNDTSISGLCGFAKKANEVLINGELPCSDILIVLSPLLQDIIYAGFYTDIEEIINNIGNIDKRIAFVYNNLLNEFEKIVFDNLYGTLSCVYNKDIECKSLIDLINPKICAKTNIVTQYNILKLHKKNILKKIIDAKKRECVPIVEDYVQVGVLGEEYNDKFDINDLVLVQNGEDVYPTNDEKAKSLTKKTKMKIE